MSPVVEKIPVPPLKLGEGPHWDIPSQSLYLVDINDSVLVRYDPKSNKSFCAKLDIPLASFIIPVAGSPGKFIVGSGINLFIVKWDGHSDKVEEVEHLVKLTNDSENNRINDGKCDPTGRLWFGTMSKTDIFSAKKGKLYSYTKADGCQEYASGVGISNGLAWEGNVMYYIDSLCQSVDCFDYSNNGKIENRRVVFDLKKNNMNCYPDGMTIDKEGKLWVACFQGSQVLQLDPKSGNLLGKVAIPTSQVTSVAWGGPNLEDIYVTTCNDHPEGGEHPDAGCTFRVTGLSTSGLPMTDFKL